MREKVRHFAFRHILGMTFIVKQNVASDPINVSLFSPDTEMFASNDVSNEVEQFRFVLRRCRGYA
jgi:hypothetical protein